MKVTLKSTRTVRLQNVIFVVLFLVLIGLLAWLSTRYHYEADWTANNRNTLSDASVALMQQMPEPLLVQAFAGDASPIKKHIADLVARYQRHKKNIELRFYNPDTDPEKVRELGITMEGEVLLAYGARSEKLAELSEEGFTNTLQRLSRDAERWLVFVEGHGERSPFGRANHDIQTWAQALKAKGFKLQGLNLVSHPIIPGNTSVLIVAGPQADYLPGELTLIETYVRNGGNLLWLADPGERHGLEGLAEQLGVRFEPGVIVDPLTQLYSIANPTFALVSEYGRHPLTRDFDLLTLYPGAAGVSVEAQDRWQAAPFLSTSSRSWSETGPLEGDVSFDDAADVAGPLNIGVSLVREREAGAADAGSGAPPSGASQQRVVVVGDGDFISNAYLGNGGNLDIAMNMVNWLSSDDQLISIPTKTALDTSLNLSETQAMVIAFGFLFALPALLLGGGVTVWWMRRRG